MKTSSLETVLGALVLIVALAFLIYSASVGDVKKVEGYGIIARFNQVGALQVGDDVRISGVKIGAIKAITLTKDNYLASVEATIDESVKIPADSAATIASTGLLGGNYLDISPGGDDVMLKDGGILQYTQDAQNLERLLGQFIFSVSDAKKTEGKEEASEDAASVLDAPASGAETAPAPASDDAMPAM